MATTTPCTNIRNILKLPGLLSQQTFFYHFFNTATTTQEAAPTANVVVLELAKAKKPFGDTKKVGYGIFVSLHDDLEFLTFAIILRGR